MTFWHSKRTRTNGIFDAVVPTRACEGRRALHQVHVQRDPKQSLVVYQQGHRGVSGRRLMGRGWMWNCTVDSGPQP